MLALAVTFGLGRAGVLEAQGRGDLQVGARILASGPSQTALAAALATTPSAADLGLARITRRVEPRVVTEADRPAIPPRAIITIAFLRN